MPKNMESLSSKSLEIMCDRLLKSENIFGELQNLVASNKLNNDILYQLIHKSSPKIDLETITRLVQKKIDKPKYTEYLEYCQCDRKELYKCIPFCKRLLDHHFICDERKIPCFIDLEKWYVHKIRRMLICNIALCAKYKIGDQRSKCYLAQELFRPNPLSRHLGLDTGDIDEDQDIEEYNCYFEYQDILDNTIDFDSHEKA